MYTFKTNDRTYGDYYFFNDANSIVHFDIDPIEQKLFNNDQVDFNLKLVRSPTRSSNLIPGILQINKQTYGRHKKKLLYKCYPNDPSLPIFLIPYQNKTSTFEKSNNNRFVLFRYENWDSKHPLGKITQNFGLVDDFKAYCKYQLFRREINTDNSIQLSKALIHNLGCRPIQNVAIELSRKFGMQNRMHYSDIFSIDPIGCTDIDDAIGLRSTSRGHIISIYIANVPVWIEYLDLWNYITNKSSTIYLPNEKLHMLPVILTEKMCSLNKDEYKPAFVMDLHVEGGKIVKTNFKSAIVRINENYYYEQEELLKNKSYIDLLKLTREICGTNSIMNSIEDSHDLVSFYMILMNLTAAKELKNLNTGIFRNKKIKALIGCNNLSSEEKQFVESWTGDSANYSLYDGLTRHDLIKKGADCYTHVTSPIRRIVDLINLVILQKQLNLIDFDAPATVYIDKQFERIEEINKEMKNISKVQADCSLLYHIQSSDFNKYEPLSGVVIEKERCELFWEYTIYIQKIKFVTKVKSSDELDKYSVRNFTIHTFVDENNLKKRYGCI